MDKKQVIVLVESYVAYRSVSGFSGREGQCELLQRQSSAFHRHSVGTRHPIDQQHFAYGMLLL